MARFPSALGLNLPCCPIRYTRWSCPALCGNQLISGTPQTKLPSGASTSIESTKNMWQVCRLTLDWEAPSDSQPWVPWPPSQSNDSCYINSCGVSSSACIALLSLLPWDAHPASSWLITLSTRKPRSKPAAQFVAHYPPTKRNSSTRPLCWSWGCCLILRRPRPSARVPNSVA